MIAVPRFPGHSSLFLAPLTVLVLADCTAAGSADSPKPPAKVDYNRDIRPILSDNCYACHGPDAPSRKAKLRFDVRESAMAALEDDEHAVVPGKVADSEMIRRVSDDDDNLRMPPPKTGKRLTPQQIAILRQWIDQGAPYAAHWAYIPPVKAEPPPVADAAWPRGPIDRFILARVEAAGLHPSPEADKPTLIRRVTLDLTGLPPTPAEVDAFLADNGPGAYEKVVDRLLASPRYGEHMARFWLDAARYGDTHGLHLDNYREIWPYRDWVIQAFNTDKPFDQFIVEQLAGDLLPNATLDQQIATGFVRCHVTTSEGGSIEEEVYTRNCVERVDGFGTVFLGLTTGCARCHDHKFDPIKQKDYYQLFAYFNNLDGPALDGNASLPPPVVKVPSPEQAAALAKFRRKAAVLRELTAEAQGRPSKQPRGFFGPRTDSGARQSLLRLRAAAELGAAELDKQIPATLVFKERPDLKPAYILKRGEYDKKGDQVGRDTPGFLPPLPKDAPRDRLGLARWLVAPSHPLTARVEVNRLWQQCFGVGLVKTAEDFGSQGEPPSHPELLDWLAVTFREDGWDVKNMMKRVVLSATYQQASRTTKEQLAKDPANRLLSRGPRFRLDAEELRDQALAVSGLLVERIGGPSVKPPQPGGLWEAVGYSGSNTVHFVADTGNEKTHRRSMYTFWKRTAPPPEMSLFDAPSRESCVVRRERTDTPLQALMMLNDPQYFECARALAERAMREGGATPEERVAFLFKAATARKPDAKETAELLANYKEQLAEYIHDEGAAKKLIAVGESKPDAKLDPSELAAWTMVANLILNLDEVITKG